LIFKIYRDRRFGAAGVGTAPPNRGWSVGVPDTEVPASAGDYLGAIGGDALRPSWYNLYYVDQINNLGIRIGATHRYGGTILLI
jgi:hypothetical protein